MFRAMVAIAMLALSTTVVIVAQSGNDLYQQGLAREAAGDLPGAIQIFERVVRESAANRVLSARALLKLGEWSDLLGREQARSYYERVAREFGDQAAVAAEAKTWLNSRRSGPLEVSTPNFIDNANFALSPDGRSVVYQSNVNSETSLWLRNIESGKEAPIPGTTSARYGNGPPGASPFWSPDGRFIGYFEDQKLKKIPMGGGTPITLAPAPRPLGGTWSGTGVIVYSPDREGPLFRIHEDGGTPVQATRVVGQEGAHRFPRFLPDGRHFLVHTIPGPVLIGSLDTRETKSIGLSSAGAFFVAPSHLAFQQQTGALQLQGFDLEKLELVGAAVQIAERIPSFLPGVGPVPVSTSATGDVAYRMRGGGGAGRRLVVRDRSGKETGLLTEMRGGFAYPRFSPDGKSLVNNQGMQTLLVNVADGEPRQVVLRAPGNLISLTILWSPKGDELLFGAASGPNDPAGPNFNLYKAPVEAPSNAQRLTDVRLDQVPYDWDGNWILFGHSTPETREDLFVLALEDPSKPIPVATTPALERNARFSPGAKWIAYESEDATGRVQVFVQPFPGDVRARRQVSTGGGSLPQWGPGGKELFFLTPDNRLAAVGTTISPDGLDIEIGPLTVLFASSVPNNSTYVPAPDGQRFVFNEAPTAVLPPPVFVLSNAAGGKR